VRPAAQKHFLGDVLGVVAVSQDLPCVLTISSRAAFEGRRTVAGRFIRGTSGIGRTHTLVCSLFIPSTLTDEGIGVVGFASA